MSVDPRATSMSAFGQPFLPDYVDTDGGADAEFADLGLTSGAAGQPIDDSTWIQYEDFDFDRVADTHAIDADDRRGFEGAPMPPGKSWILWSITIPNRLALASLISIGVYEILVAVSMAVRSLRSLMVNGLMYALLAWNVLLLLMLLFLVVKARTGFTFEFITKRIQRSKRIQEDS